MEWKIISNKSALPSEKCSHRTASESVLTLYQSTGLCRGEDFPDAVQPAQAECKGRACSQHPAERPSGHAAFQAQQEGNSLLLPSSLLQVVKLHQHHLLTLPALRRVWASPSPRAAEAVQAQPERTQNHPNF